MRRMLIGASQEKLGEALGLTFQQVQKYEKGANRIGASRLFQIGCVLGVPVEYFYEGLDNEDGGVAVSTVEPAHFALDHLSTAEGIQLNSAFFSIEDTRLRKRILDLIKHLAGDNASVDGVGLPPEN